ncbi:hypothetical protein GKC29_05625 [Micromonospora sp. WMMC415]|uniref:hypothetical protein n=1 Tax=Micromonospora sp. WMMC415 TaxID=2675222 RepID=UPI0012B4A7DA|nr:hypothetical protein [Micromonospora sp. WMMC415]QGN46363.1 hypothetical protein GKC29_05625 [Micromonospora sp. WMMC415]
MTVAITNLAAAERMSPDDYVVTALAADFASRGPLSFERFLAGYYAESLRIVHEAHLADCTVGDGRDCATCAGIRVGLAGLIAEEKVVTSGEVTGHGR